MSKERGKVALAVRLVFLTVVAAMIGAIVWLRAPTPPIAERDGDPRWRNKYGPHDDIATPGILSAEKAREIAVAEVKNREGWLGTAGVVSQEGLHYYVTVRGEFKRAVTIDGRTRKVEEYRDLEP
jgi:hypothetical protein